MSELTPAYGATRPESNYVQFGPAWKAEMMRMTKSQLVDMYKAVCIELQQTKTAPGGAADVEQTLEGA